MKQAESTAHSSGRSGGDNRVFDCPSVGVLQTMAIATVLMQLPSVAAFQRQSGDRYRPYDSTLTVAILIRPVLGLGLQSLAAQLFADAAILEIAALRRALRRLVPLRQPIAERIAEPGRLRAQRSHTELLPDCLGTLHVFLFGQRQRRHIALHGGVHQQRGVFFLIVLTLRPVALAAMRQQ